MNCIEAIEGTVKSVLSGLYQVFINNRLDDTEYIRNVKAVLEATNVFLKDNEEIVGDSKMLEQVLYTFSKELWLKNLEKIRTEEPISDKDESASENDDEYNDYYYDYIYNQGVYPP